MKSFLKIKMIPEVTTFFWAIIAIFSSWWAFKRLLRGTGKRIGFFFSLIFGILAYILGNASLYLVILILISAGVIEFWYQKKKITYSYSHFVYEGGGIRRGLTPIEVGVLNQLSPSNLFILALIELLQKGFIEDARCDDGKITVILDEEFKESQTIINPKTRRETRRRIANQKMKELFAHEDILLELFIQNKELSLGDNSIKPWVDFLCRSVDAKIIGFDLSHSKSYYIDFLTHRLSGMRAGHFDPLKLVGWVVLGTFLENQQFKDLETLLKETRPHWIDEDENFQNWITSLQSTSS